VVGVWHGAGFNFIYFGLVNAIGVIIVRLLQKFGVPPLPFVAAYFINILYAAIALLCFRQTDVEALTTILRRMAAISGGYFSWRFSGHEAWVLGLTLLIGYAFVLFAPNILELFARDILNLKSRPSLLEAPIRAAYATVPGRVAIAIVTFFCLVSILNPTFFIYFQF
jgi:alginate O-acetyltransferase complex protein AlgI